MEERRSKEEITIQIKDRIRPMEEEYEIHFSH